MRKLTIASALMLSAMMAGAAAGQEDAPADPPREARPERERMRREAIERFDENGDGELNDDERAKARAFREERMRDRGRRGDRRPDRPRDGERRRPDGPRPGGPEGRGPDGPGPGGPDGPERRRPPNPMRLFDEFDADDNGQLSREEFERVMRRIYERRGPAGPPDGDRRRVGPPPVRGPGGPDRPDRGPDDRPRRGRGEDRRQRPPRDADATQSPKEVEGIESPDPATI